MSSTDGWFADPTGRHEYRWYQGGAWTDTVSDGGVTGSDPVDPVGPDPEAPTDAAFVAPGAGSGDTDADTSPAPAWSSAPAWPAAPEGAAPTRDRLRTGAPGPLAWAAALLSAPGVLFVLYGVFVLFLANAIDDFNDDFGGDIDTSDVSGVGFVLLLVGGVYLAAAVGLSMAAGWARIVATVLGGLHAVASLAALSDEPAVGVVMLLLAGGQIWLVWTPSASAAIATRAIDRSEVADPAA